LANFEEEEDIKTNIIEQTSIKDKIDWSSEPSRDLKMIVYSYEFEGKRFNRKKVPISNKQINSGLTALDELGFFKSKRGIYVRGLRTLPFGIGIIAIIGSVINSSRIIWDRERELDFGNIIDLNSYDCIITREFSDLHSGFISNIDKEGGLDKVSLISKLKTTKCSRAIKMEEKFNTEIDQIYITRTGSPVAIMSKDCTEWGESLWKPLPDTKIKVRGTTKEDRCTGKLCVKGPQVVSKYYPREPLEEYDQMEKGFDEEGYLHTDLDCEIISDKTFKVKIPKPNNISIPVNFKSP
jgi:hypothetical protein